MEPEILAATNELRQFLFDRVYVDSEAKKEESKAQSMLAQLFGHFMKHPEALPRQYGRNVEKEGAARCVCDYLSCMTDRFAIELYREIFIPEVWRVK